MATRNDKTTRRPQAAAQSAVSATGTNDARVVAFAEQMGRLVGTVYARTEGWADSQGLKDQLARIRDGATDLLNRLGSATAPASASAPRKQHPQRGRSGGKVDAPGKKHRKAPPATPGIKHSDLMIPKVTAAQKIRKGRRGG